MLLAYEAGRLRDVCLWIGILLSVLSMFVLVVANSLGESKKDDAESVGNAAKMRKALLGARVMAVGSVNCGGGEPWNRLVDTIDEALAAPTRNCDLYADEQSAWEAFSEKRQGPDSSTEEYEQWLFEKATE